MAFQIVAQASEIEAGGRKVVDIRGRSIVVFNVDGEYFALLNRCPHQGAQISYGHIGSPITSTTPGEYSIDCALKIVRCPWHGWEFDIRTGQSWCEPSRIKVRSFATDVKSGGELVKGPYVAETFPIKVDGEYILVDA